MVLLNENVVGIDVSFHAPYHLKVSDMWSLQRPLDYNRDSKSAIVLMY